MSSEDTTNANQKVKEGLAAKRVLKAESKSVVNKKTPKKQGRPTLSKDDKKNHQICLYFNDAEYEEIMDNAKAIGLDKASIYLMMQLRVNKIV